VQFSGIQSVRLSFRCAASGSTGRCLLAAAASFATSCVTKAIAANVATAATFSALTVFADAHSTTFTRAGGGSGRVSAEHSGQRDRTNSNATGQQIYQMKHDRISKINSEKRMNNQTTVLIRA
jgi:hypothetical protein